MERWMGSRTARWVIVLGAGLLALRVGLTKYRLGAEETKEAPAKTPATKQLKREALRYGGKNFDQWRVEMETELKPEVRADGMTAMGAFGANGYAAEATRTIVDLMADYDVDTRDEKVKAVIEAAKEAIDKIDRPALPILWETVCRGNERSRLFAIDRLEHSYYCCPLTGEDGWHPAVAELLKAARQKDKNVRELALGFLGNVKNKPKSCLPALLECLTDKVADIRKGAIYCLDKMRPEAKEVMSALKTAIENSEPAVRYSALLMAGHYGAQATPLVPALLKRLEKPEALSRSIPDFFDADEFVALMNTLAAVGPAAKEALPRLRKLREKPVAKSEAHPEVGKTTTSREIIDQTIKKIEGK